MSQGEAMSENEATEGGVIFEELIYLAIIEDPAEAAAAEEAMTSKENRIHTKNHT